jgi:hypothetical protein
MNTPRDSRQLHNLRNVATHEDRDRYLQTLLKMLPTKIIPLTLSQQFQVAKMNRLISTPITQKPDTP